jgi:hypothetical protein
LKLQFVMNSNWDLFFVPEEARYYLLAGKIWLAADSLNGPWSSAEKLRWFRATSLSGPWIYASDDLPEDFRNIPQNSNAAEVLASVPGTPEAEDVVLLAQIPTTAVLKRSEAEAKVKVAYQGDPEFVPIEGTTMSYASNADADVIRIEDKYYLCANAVWFVSVSPTGPWQILTDVPPVIYTIPPNCPVYHVTYAHVESSTPEEVVCSYTSGYSGTCVAAVAAGAALIWGTGYYYPPYVYSGRVPYYRPYYATYGVAATYFPYNGAYAVGGYAYGPYNAAGRAAWYNPATGAYGRAYTTQYPYGGRTSARGYNPATNTSWTTQQGHGYYAQWGISTVTRGGNTPPSRNQNSVNSQGPQKNSLSSTNSPGATSENRGQSRSSESPRAQTAQNANRSETKNLQGEQEKRSRQESSRQSSNDLTRSLDREASARQRGSQNSNLQRNLRENRAPQRRFHQEGRRSEAGPQRAETRHRG